MTMAEIGSTVTITYIGTLDNGRIFHSTDEHGPLAVTIGAQQVLAGLEKALIGMRAGEVKNVVLSAVEASSSRRCWHVSARDEKLSTSLFPVDFPLCLFYSPPTISLWCTILVLPVLALLGTVRTTL